MEELLTRFFNGECYDAYKYFGAHLTSNGYVFRVYAPNALEVELIGDFNNYDGSKSKMNKIDDRGIYELYVNIHEDYHVYRYNIRTKNNKWIKKSDPYAFFSELRPDTASKTFNYDAYQIKDSKYIEKRTKCFDKPLNIYELHLGSWITKLDGSYMSYEEIIPYLIKYLKENHFTHVEIMPLMEGPLDNSWGYLCSGYFSITSRYGNPIQFKILVEALHNNGFGIIMDFVPLHFIKDDYALYNFDGSHVYESYYKDKRFSQWGSILFDFSKTPVMSFVLSSLYYFINEYHIDGIRFDAISNMIFKDGNKFNGLNEPNLNWMKKANNLISSLFPTVMLIAEDSSDYDGVTRPTFEGGLGFDYKWDLGWMNDTIKYLKEDPYFRGDHLNLINFSMYYFYNERFLLPLSHDEVVHMKGSIINKIWGSYEQKFQQLRTLYTYMFTHPGKKLNFMSNELASFDEWKEYEPVNFDILKYPLHDAFKHFFDDLSYLYTHEKCLYKDEYSSNTFNWIDCTNKSNVFIYERNYKNDSLVIILNFSGVQFDNYSFNVSKKEGYYQEIINSDDYKYNGYGYLNNYDIGINNSRVEIRIPAFSAVVLKYKGVK